MVTFLGQIIKSLRRLTLQLEKQLFTANGKTAIYSAPPCEFFGTTVLLF